MKQNNHHKQIYQGDVITLEQVDVKVNEQVFQKDVILHPGGVGILVFVSGCILLVEQYRYAIEQITLEIPAGKLRPNEDPVACGLRELEEETSFSTSTLHPMYMMYSTPGVCNEKIYLFYTQQLHKVSNPLEMDVDEDIHIKWVSLQDCLTMIEDGFIQDAKTILAIQYAALHLEKKV